MFVYDKHFNCLLSQFAFSGTSQLTSLLLLYFNKEFVMEYLHLVYNCIPVLDFLLRNICQFNNSIAIIG